MTRPARWRRLAMLLPLLWGAETAQADDGVPALLQFAEQYHRETPFGSAPQPEKPDSGPKAPRSGAARPAALPPALSASPVGDSPTLRRALKQRDAQLARQQTALREQEKQLSALRQTLAAAEERLKAQDAQKEAVPPAPSAGLKPADFAPLQQLVGRLRDAAGGSPDAKRSAELITQAREQAASSRSELINAQAQIRALKLQVGDLKKQAQSGEQGAERTQQAGQVLQAKLDGALAQLNEKTNALQASQQQAKDAEAARMALTRQLAALQKAQRERQQSADKTQAVTLAAHEKRVGELEAQLGEQKTVRTGLQTAVEQKDAALAALRTEKLALQAQHDALQQQVGSADARLASQAREVVRLQDDIKALRERARWLVKPDVLTDSAGRQAYAAGSALGHDIVEMLDERKGWGVNADRQTVLAGVIDAFSGQYQLTTDVLSKSLAESEAVVNQARQNASRAQQKKGEAFVADFKKQKGVKQSPSGFWYRVNYAGDAAIGGDAVVEVVVKESLADGTVVQDMDLSGNVLSQPLSAYPPLFREAIGQLRNHGSLTMVVPPELAYGEAGYPPKVPPNATVVYELRVDDVRAAASR